jgi:hypothetical protein
MLAERLPATAAEDTARKEQETARLHKRLRKIDAAENAHAREIENLASLPQDSPAITALRSRIIARFTELETERTEINDRLAVLERATGQRDEPGLLDKLPILGDILADAPPSTQARLFAAVGLELIYNKQDHQVTIYATITPSTPQALADIITSSEPPATAAGVALSSQHPRMWAECQPPQTDPVPARLQARARLRITRSSRCTTSRSYPGPFRAASHRVDRPISAGISAAS